jgi:hypothetical protein
MKRQDGPNRHDFLGAGLRPSLTGLSTPTRGQARLSSDKQLAHELGPHGITVIRSVARGFVRSNPATERMGEL